ncbi:phage tail tape measure protein [Geomicrobium sp. JCM 19038]|uniref:phage tail tape measure protein n=1 Tax=Geomicrobium sp. JCM 19038 TaxID=1460635 RepID=UPI00045F177A|nr:phage tail tape measure protein [Geomicrobium sp. JCM 19038]GAK09005.1 phage tail length tape-measure protein [Geomicrobium sp. JCM 19038]
MQELGKLRIGLDFDSADATQSVTDLNRNLRTLNSEYNVLRASGDGFGKSTDGLRLKQDNLTKRLERQKTKAEQLKKEYDQLVESKGKNSKEAENMAIRYNNALAAAMRTENQLSGLDAEIKKQESSWFQLGTRLEETGNKMQAVGKGITSTGKTLTKAVTVPLTGVGLAALKVGMDFESSMSKVQALTGESGDAMDALTEQAKHLGETTVFSASQAADGMAFLGMAGWETSAILEGMPGLLDLAASAQMDLGRAADITSNIMAAFSLEAAESSRVSDVLAKAASNANTNVEQMGEAMGYVAPSANTLGLSMEETAAAVMAVSDAGIQGSRAGRAFGTSLTRLAKPTSQMEDVMTDLGLAFFNANGEMESIPAMVGQLETAFADMTEEQQAAALSTLFGAEAMRHWAILVDQGSESLAANTQMLEESEGAAAEMANTMMDNAQGALIEFKSALEGAGIALSEHLLPSVTSIIESGTDLVRKFSDLDESTQKWIVGLGLTAAAIGPVMMVIGPLVTALGTIVTTLGTASIAIAGAGGLTAAFGGLAAAAGPVGLAIGGVALAVGGLTAAHHLLKDETLKLNDVSTENAEKMLAQADSVETLANRYDELMGLVA